MLRKLQEWRRKKERESNLLLQEPMERMLNLWLHQLYNQKNLDQKNQVLRAKKDLKIKNQLNHLMELARDMMIKVRVHLKDKALVNKARVQEKVIVMVKVTMMII